ncbi:histidine phosphatase family protein [Nocardioides oleivorans]|uniref:Histidine phosphatase family protein n=1 Tax=Nocardioides oleivorans TaxID=273676 RepID=A0A4V1RK50_9ACTN|nr:histidine phosphatase family protein [Nocardioides oleivorans]RYB91052.1 histidine phosphatase family protein [Nocardioides oleivorans]
MADRPVSRVVVARHGEALYESELLSDAGGWLSPLGREQAAGLGELLAAEVITRVWTSDMSRAVQTGEIVAARLGVDVVVRTGVREFGVGAAAGTTGVPDPFAETFAAWVSGDLAARIPGGESGDEVVARWSGVLEAIADEHEGESALLVSHGGVMSMVLPLLATNLDPGHARDRPIPNCGHAVLERGAAGWVVRSWLGDRLDP